MLFKYNMRFYLDQANRGRFILNLLYAIIMTYYKHSICFSGSGYHYPWQVGVALYLQEHYNLNECCFLGVSGGSYVATLLALKLSIREYVFMWIKEAYRDFKKRWLLSYFVCHSVIRRIHLKYLSQDDFLKANGRLFISITKFKCFLKNQVINQFHSNEDLVDAICTSSQIPFMLSPTFSYTFRGERCLDGGFSYNWMKLNDDTIMISPYQWSRMRYFYALTGFLHCSEKNFYYLVNKGYNDAKANDYYFHRLPKKRRLIPSSS